VSFKLTDIAPVAVGIGMIIYLFSSNERNKKFAEILIGFGILFIGMDFMKHAVKPLREVQAFTDALVSFGHNPLLGILMGFGLTVIVQSSSASMGILLALASEGLMPLSSALPILYGENIGTCVTALLSSIGASKNAKRAAIMHLTFNIIGTTIFALILSTPITAIVTKFNPTDVTRQIANAHTLFNIINVVVQFPFAMFIVKIAMTIIPEKEDEKEYKLTKYIDDRILETPSIALLNSVRESLRMGKKARISFESSINGLLNKSRKEVDETFEKERKINELQKILIEYLMKLSNKDLSVKHREIVDGLFHIIGDIERVGDHADNIAELAVDVIENDIVFSDSATQDIKDMFEKVMLSYKTALEAMKNADIDLALSVLKIEEEIDKMEKVYRKNHIYRLNNNKCNIESGIVFLELISNMERIGDHASNIAKYVIDVNPNS
jgi:phosphate:Na+ symporter